MAENRLVFIDVEHKPKNAGFLCPHCGEGVYTINNHSQLLESEPWVGYNEQTWLNVACEVCGAMFDLCRTIYPGTPPKYTGSLILHDGSEGANA